MMPGRFSMKLNINTEKIFQNGPKNPAMLASVLIIYGAAMALAVLKSIKDSEGGEEAAG